MLSAIFCWLSRNRTSASIFAFSSPLRSPPFLIFVCTIKHNATQNYLSFPYMHAQNFEPTFWATSLTAHGWSVVVLKCVLRHKCSCCIFHCIPDRAVGLMSCKYVYFHPYPLSSRQKWCLISRKVQCFSYSVKQARTLTCLIFLSRALNTKKYLNATYTSLFLHKWTPATKFKDTLVLSCTISVLTHATWFCI